MKRFLVFSLVGTMIFSSINVQSFAYEMVDDVIENNILSEDIAIIEEDDVVGDNSYDEIFEYEIEEDLEDEEIELLGDTGYQPKISNPRIVDGVTTWDCVYFGKYWQNDTNGDGTADKNDNKEQIKWRVLSVQNNQALLLADKVLDGSKYNDRCDDVSVTWKDSALRSWLNGYGSSENHDNVNYSSSGKNFINDAFSSSEINDICYGSDEINDKVFLLAYDDINSGIYGKRIPALATLYAGTHGAQYITDGTYPEGTSFWWLRSRPPIPLFLAHIVGYDGEVEYETGQQFNEKVGVRPSIYLDMSKLSWEYAGKVTSDGEVTPPSDFTGGSGSKDDPYIISDVSDFNNIRKHLDSHYKIVSDIDIINQLTPIGTKTTPFTGTIDGQNNTIVIRSFNPNTDWGRHSMFNYVSNATFKNITVLATNSITHNAASGMSSRSVTGGLLVGSGSGTITNCHARGNMSLEGDSDAIGGLIAGDFNGTIVESSAEGSINCYGHYMTHGMGVAGGIVGIFAGTMSNCYANVQIKAYGTSSINGEGYMGGLVGNAKGNVKVNNSYFVGTMTDYHPESYKFYTGGIVAKYTDDKTTTVKCTNCYYNCELAKEKWDYGAGKRTLTALKKSITYYGWDWENVWGMNKSYNEGLPYLKSMCSVESEVEYSASCYPSVGQENVAPGDNVVLTFDHKSISKGENYSEIVIKEYDTDNEIPTEVLINGEKVIIHPMLRNTSAYYDGKFLKEDTKYYVNIPENSILINGENFDGISDKSYYFTTGVMESPQTLDKETYLAMQYFCDEINPFQNSAFDGKNDYTKIYGIKTDNLIGSKIYKADKEGERSKIIGNEDFKESISNTLGGHEHKEFFSQELTTWRVDKCYENLETGFFATVFTNIRSKQSVISYAASNPMFKETDYVLGSDWDINDLPLYFGNKYVPQMDDALHCFDNYYKGHEGYELSTTGHSLGAGLGTFVGQARDIKAVTFDSVPMLDVSYFRAPLIMGQYFKGVDKWKTLDVINEDDILAGTWEKEYKNIYECDTQTTSILDKHNKDSILCFKDGKFTLSPGKYVSAKDKWVKSMSAQEQAFLNPNYLSIIFPASTIQLKIEKIQNVIKLMISRGLELSNGFNTYVTLANSGELEINGKSVRGSAANDILKDPIYNDYLDKDLIELLDSRKATSPNNVIYGGEGNNIIKTADGDDILIAGDGNDTADGGNGNDTYVYWKNQGTLTICDTSGIDTLQILGINNEDSVSYKENGESHNIYINGNNVISISKKRITGSAGQNNKEKSSFTIEIYDDNRSKRDSKVITSWNLWENTKNFCVDCPTNIDIYDSKGQLVKTIDDESPLVEYEDWGYFYNIDNGDGDYTKMVTIDGDYSVEVVATDNGQMNCYVTDFDDEGNLITFGVQDVDIISGEKSDVDFDNKSIIDDNGNEILMEDYSKLEEDIPSDDEEPTNEWLNKMSKVSDTEYVLNLATKEKLTISELAKTKSDGKNYKIKYDKIGNKSDSQYATMTAKGLITAKKAGIAHITLTKGGVDYKITVNVFNPQFKYESPKKKYFTVNTGATIIPAYDDCKLKPTFTIDKNAIKKGLATINAETGEVTPLKKGNVKVTATVGEGKLARKVTATIKIYDPIINTGKKSEVMVGKMLKASVKNGVKGTNDWKSSNEAIATIDFKGKIKGVAVGTVTISCTNNGKTISKEITVVENPRLK